MSITTEAIVLELAALTSSEVSPLDGWQIDSWCLFCGSMETYDKKDPTAHHEPKCLWRRAVEWRNGCTTVPYGDKTILANRVCTCEHLNTEHDFDNPIQACEVCDCTGFIVGGKKVSP